MFEASSSLQCDTMQSRGLGIIRKEVAQVKWKKFEDNAGCIEIEPRNVLNPAVFLIISLIFDVCGFYYELLTTKWVRWIQRTQRRNLTHSSAIPFICISFVPCGKDDGINLVNGSFHLKIYPCTIFISVHHEWKCSQSLCTSGSSIFHPYREDSTSMYSFWCHGHLIDPIVWRAVMYPNVLFHWFVATK